MATIVPIHEAQAPTTSERIGTRQFLELTGLSEAILAELIRMDWIAPVRTAQDEFLFLRCDVFRVRKFVRLCDDFELNAIAGTIIVDLLDRIDGLERRVRTLSQRY